MDFSEEMVVRQPPGVTWATLADIRRVAACVPGCAGIEELDEGTRYRAVMKQRVGPFRLEVPLTITLKEMLEPTRIHAVASGRDRVTGTSIEARLTVTLAPAPDGATRLSFVTALQVAGRLAALGYPVIRRRAAEDFTEFAQRLRATLESV